MLNKPIVDGEPDVMTHIFNPPTQELVEEDQEFKVSLSYLVGSCLKNKQANKRNLELEPRKGTEEGETCRQTPQVPTCEKNMFRTFIFPC